jgi:hypothetical protein
MTNERYNGWTNYPTWCINLWLSNDEGLYNIVCEAAQREITNAPDHANVPEIWTEKEAATFMLADYLEDDLCQIGGELGLVPELEGFPNDIMGWALGQVDWQEIAEHAIADGVEVEGGE